MVATGEVKCIDDEIPFEIPQGWEWCRLGDLSRFNGGYAFKSFNYVEKEKGIRVLRISDFNESEINSKSPVYYPYTPELEKARLEQNDIVMCMTGGTVGKSFFVKELNEPMLVNQRVADIKINKCVLAEYIFKVISSSYIKEIVNEAKNSTNDNISANLITNFLIPLPPLAEQHRIVSKIEELMPLVDEYGKSEEELKALNASLPEALKKSILQEAIQGKLVPQRAEEGTAEELLAEIRKEKERLVKEGELKRSALSDSVIYKGDDNKYYEQIDEISKELDSDFNFPESWSVIKLKDICQLTDGIKKDSKYICLDAKFLRGKSSGEYQYKGKFVYKGDDIILVDGENSGEVFSVPIDGYLGSTFKQLWISSEMYKPYVLLFILFYKDRLRNSKKGAAIPHLNKEIFYNLLIGIPPKQEQERIVYRANMLFKHLK